MTSTIAKPEEFRAQIESLSDRVSVHRACNELLEQLTEKYAISTMSKMLSRYRGELSKITKPKISETISTKEGLIKQHIAINLLKLNSTQDKNLKEERNKVTNKSLGFDEEGNLRQVEMPKIDITAVISKALNLLSSNDYRDLSCAILLLTGLRPTEQALSKRYYEKFDKVIDRDMVALEDNRIAFKGLNKKRKLEDIESYFVRPCLTSSEVLVKHQKRFVSLSPWTDKTCEKTINKSIERQFNKLFADDLATIADYDENGNASKANAYKMRAFYACALRASLIAKGMGENQAAAYIQKALGHDSAAETVKYLSKYEAHRFINPIDLDLDLNINEVGKMLVEVPQETDFTVNVKNEYGTENQEFYFSPEKFLDGLTDEQRISFLKTLEDTRDLTTALLSLVNTTQSKKVSEEVSQNEKVEKVSVVDRIEEIYQGIVGHNQKQEKPQDCLYPSWGLVDKISKKVFDKTIAKVTFDTWEGKCKNSVEQHLESIGIPASDRNALWNGKYHRKSIGSKIDDVVSIITNGRHTD